MAIHPHKRAMFSINVLGGIAVLGSYAYGLSSHPSTGGELWGDVPEALRPFYVAWMSVAATSYFLFTTYLLFRADPHAARVARRFDLRVFNLLYAAILVPSALWMPLTFEMLANPSRGLWLAIRLVLWAVGLGSLAFIAALLSLRPRRPARAYWLAVAGSVAFTVQTGLLDALVWVACFPA